MTAHHPHPATEGHPDMPRRNRSTRTTSRRPRGATTAPADQEPDLDAIARDLVARGICSPLVLDPRPAPTRNTTTPERNYTR